MLLIARAIDGCRLSHGGHEDRKEPRRARTVRQRANGERELIPFREPSCAWDVNRQLLDRDRTCGIGGGQDTLESLDLRPIAVAIKQGKDRIQKPLLLDGPCVGVVDMPGPLGDRATESSTITLADATSANGC